MNCSGSNPLTSPAICAAKALAAKMVIRWTPLVHATSAGPGGTVEFTPYWVPDAIWIDHYEGKSQLIRQLLSHCKGFRRRKRSRLRDAWAHLLVENHFGWSGHPATVSAAVGPKRESHRLV